MYSSVIEVAPHTIVYLIFIWQGTTRSCFTHYTYYLQFKHLTHRRNFVMVNTFFQKLGNNLYK